MQVTQSGKGLALAGWLVFVVCGVCCIWSYGTQWGYGPKLGMPVPLMEKRGQFYYYRDGLPAHPYDVFVHESGMAEEINGTALLTIGLISAGLLLDMVRGQRKLESKIRSLSPGELVELQKVLAERGSG
jgi:hypothetical protein